MDLSSWPWIYQPQRIKTFSTFSWLYRLKTTQCFIRTFLFSFTKRFVQISLNLVLIMMYMRTLYICFWINNFHSCLPDKAQNIMDNGKVVNED
jgi:hypothetical protein